MKLKLHFFLMALLCFNIGFSQEKPVKQDSTKMYENIEKYSKKRKFTKMFHKLIFEPIKNKNAVLSKKLKKKSRKNFEDKIIRNINIQTLDPFGFSISDTTKKAKNWVEKSGNSLHITTRKLAIKNLLLFRKNKPLDTLLVSESERLIRLQKYVRDVKITIEPVTQNTDSVDVFIRVLDTWSSIPKGSVSSSRASIGLQERNFLGTGHEFYNRFSKRFEDGKSAYRMKYEIPNIKNTYIKTTVDYHTELNNHFGKSLNVERAFYSPFTRWAGGVYLDEQFSIDSLQNAKFEYNNQNLKYRSQDIWGGISVPIFNEIVSRYNHLNLVFATRILNVQFKESPTIEYDSINFYAGETFYLSSIGISSRQFVEDEYLYNYGIIENVPVGRIFGITGGYQLKNNQRRLYLGARASFGNYHSWGYLSANFEYGSFFNASKTEQSAFSFQVNYFTNLVEFGKKWKMRQFIKPQIIIGNDRLKSKADYLALNENVPFQGTYGAGFQGDNSAGINGFDSALFGTKKFVLSLQTQLYSPWNIIGFRINPYINYTAAMLGNENIGLTKSKLYSSIGIGVMINNDYLVFNSFQFSISFYPNIPGQGNNIFKTNSYGTSDFGLQDFDFGKPRTVIYK
ncbi:MAG TPA: hypothetical protein VLM44_04115 [Lutibacter sp.]|nr:hypothetical protein [Lutibacter sp.]